MTKPARFTVPDLARALKAFEKAGVPVAGAEFTDRGFRILTGEPTAANDSGRPNPLDRLHGSKA